MAESLPTNVNPLLALLPLAKARVYVPLPPAEVWGRLVGDNPQEWQIGASEPFDRVPIYTVAPRRRGSSFDISGPSVGRGPAFSTTATTATLAASGAGTSLELTTRMRLLNGLFIVAPVLWLAFGPRIAGIQRPVEIGFLALLLALAYGMAVMSVKQASRVIKDYCVLRLSDDWKRVLF